MQCFNPHPRRGAGAAAQLAGFADTLSVSILTRAEARVLPTAVQAVLAGMTKFQSSPAPRRGCCC